MFQQKLQEQLSSKCVGIMVVASVVPIRLVGTAVPASVVGTMVIKSVVPTRLVETRNLPMLYLNLVFHHTR